MHLSNVRPTDGDQRYLPLDPSDLDYDLLQHLRVLAESQHETPMELWADLRMQYLRRLEHHQHDIEETGVINDHST